MSCKSLLALSLVGAVVLFLTGSASAYPPCLAPAVRPVCTPAPVRPPVCSPAPVEPSVSPGELPGLAPEPNRHTMTIFNGACVTQQNFVEKNGSWRNSGEFKNYDVLFRDSPRVPWRSYGTYYSARSAEDAASILRANGNLASVREHCA